jgi:cbb3-type cytochrome oxidase subunit 1
MEYITMKKNQMLRLSANIKKFKDVNQIDFMIDAIHDFGWDDVDNEIRSIKTLNELLEVGLDGLNMPIDEE